MTIVAVSVLLLNIVVLLPILHVDVDVYCHVVAISISKALD